MAEWLIEEGIAEHRAVLLDGERIVAARVAWPGEVTAGLVADAKLIARAAGSSRGTARLATGEEVLVDRLPSGASEGAAIRIEVTRPALSEGKRGKLARGRPAAASPRPVPTLAENLRASGDGARVVRQFPGGEWDDLIAEAFAGEVAFPGGSLQFSATPAMLLVDVDGTVAPGALALAAVPALANALRRFDVGGSAGIDFPTLSAKADRRAVDEALAVALTGWPHERTAINGFGFVQLVARLERPSLLQRAAFRPAELAARLLLRRAERLEGQGAVLLSSHPAVDAALTPATVAELARRTGREVRRAAAPALAVEAPHAQLVPR